MKAKKLTEARKLEIAGMVADELNSIIEDKNGWREVIAEAGNFEEWQRPSQKPMNARERAWAVKHLRFTLLDEPTGQDMLEPEANRPKIAVIVSGGCVVDVFCNLPAQCVVVDYDGAKHCDDPDQLPVVNKDGDRAEVSEMGVVVHQSPGRVEQLLKLADYDPANEQYMREMEQEIRERP